MAVAPSRAPITRAEYEELVRRGACEGAQYWIVNLNDEVLEVHRQPAAQGYASVTRHARGEAVRLENFPHVEVRVADVLPPAGR